MKNTAVPQVPEPPKVRIAVLGKVNVGKSALTVRYLTRRFIGEYRSKTDFEGNIKKRIFLLHARDLLYRQTMTINNTPLEVEIVDVSGGESDDENEVFPAEEVAWADGCLVVYSITDRDSFEYAEETLRRLRPTENNSSTESAPVSNMSTIHQQPIVLLGNKADLEHLRQVQGTEGKNAASKCCRNAKFYEVSVAENSKDLYAAFEALITECSSRQSNTSNGVINFANDNNNNSNHQNGNNRFQVTPCNQQSNNQNIIQAQQIKVQRKFSVSKMIGNLIGKSVGNGGGGGGNPQQQQVASTGVQQGQNQQQQPTQQGGTVTVFQKSDLHRSRVLKRRNNCAPASASL